MDPPIIGIVGAGFQGRSIGQRFASSGMHVKMLDPSQAQLTRAVSSIRSPQARARVTTTTEMRDFADCALIIEAIPEILERKQALLAELAKIAPDAVLSSNSSSFRPEEIAARLQDKRRFLNLHFLGPDAGNFVLELIPSADTAPSAVESTEAWLRDAGFVPVRVGSCRAFVYNRLYDAGVSNFARTVDLGLIDIERFCRYNLSFRPRARQADVLDHLGLDVVLAVLQSCRAAYGRRYAVPAWMERLVAEGRFGVKSGRGMLDHQGGPVVLRDPPLAPAERPRSPFVRVAVRRPHGLVASFLSGLSGRKDRELLVTDVDAQRFFGELTGSRAAYAAEFRDRFRIVGSLAGQEVDLVLDCEWVESPEEKAAGIGGALKGTSPDAPLLVCAPIGSQRELQSAITSRPVAMAFAANGMTLNPELVAAGDAPSYSAVRDLVLESHGRALEVNDGEIRPFAAFVVPRLLEAMRIVTEGVATEGQVVQLCGENILADQDLWSGALLRRVVSSLDAALDTSLLE
jgi:3-hydroxybutyryl-CoA dehydrogenase